MACSSALPSPRPILDHGALATIDTADFPGADTLLRGFDAVSSDRIFRVGDSALFALAVHHGVDVERRLLRLRVDQLGGAAGKVAYSITTVDSSQVTRDYIFNVTPIEIEISQFAADGSPVRTSRVRLYEEFLTTGLRFCTGDDIEAGARAGCLLRTLERLGGDDPLLADQLFAIADRPSWLAILGHFGVHVRLTVAELEPWRGRGMAYPSDDLVVLPIDVMVNDAKSVISNILLTSAKPPFALTGGVLGVIARSATDPSRIAILRLLAARRGAAQ